MKRIVLFISLLISVGAGAQLTNTYLGGPNSLIIARGPIRSDSSLGNPIRDTSFRPYSVGIQVYRSADSSIYVSVSTTAARKWKKVGDATPSSAWGTITGTLSSQTDLVAALALKQNLITTGTSSQYIKGDLTLGTFSSAVTALTDPLYSPIGHSHSGLAPSGGTTGQVLTKINSTDYNYQWSNPAAGSGTVTNVASGLWLGGGPITTTGTLQVDSSALFNSTTGALRRKDSLTSSNLLGYVTRKILSDSAAAIRSAFNTLPYVTGGSLSFTAFSTRINLSRNGTTDTSFAIIGGAATNGDFPFYNGTNMAWNSTLRSTGTGYITFGGDTLATRIYASSVGGGGGLSLSSPLTGLGTGTVTPLTSSHTVLEGFEDLQAQISDPFYVDTDYFDGGGTSVDPLTFIKGVYDSIYGLPDSTGFVLVKTTGLQDTVLMTGSVGSSTPTVSEKVIVTSSTSYSVTSTDVNVIYEGGSGGTMTLGTPAYNRVLYITNTTANTLTISETLWTTSGSSTVSIAPNSNIKTVYSTTASKWYRIYQND